MKLHRLHAHPAMGKGGCSLDVGEGNAPDGSALRGIRWRPHDAKDRDVARAQAYRLALCWNICEGWPNEALEGGTLRHVEDMAEGLARACLAGEDCDQLREMATALLDRFAVRDRHYDKTGGRPADCDACYPVWKRDR